MKSSFSEWFRNELTSRGYDLSIRGGGQTAFAKKAGVSRPTISRLLRDEGTSNIGTLALVAKALDRPLTELLVRANILDEDIVHDAQNPQSRRITPEEAATALGITNEHDRRAFVSMTQGLLRQPPPSTTGEDDLADS